MIKEPKSQKSASYIIENVEVWTESGALPKQSVWVEDGVLREIAAQIDRPAERINGHGKVLMAAGVDAQTHLRVPGQAHKEQPKTGLLAALRGGYCALLTMPNTQPTIDSVAVLKTGQEQTLPYEREYGVTVFWSAAITQRLNSDELTAYEDLVRAGVRAFTNDGLGVNSDQVMDQAFARIANLGVPLLQHAEFAGHGGTLAPGPIQEQVQATPYSDEPEWKMVERDLRELRKHPTARYHVLHVSSRKTLDLVRDAKAEGLQVTAEVSPHHLFFNCETIDPHNTSFKMNPPIRSPKDQQALWQGLVNGDVDFVATDHAPHEPLMKDSEFERAAFGTIGLETTLPVLLEAWRNKVLSIPRLLQVWASAPARFLRLPGGLGELKVGTAFHAILVDVAAPAHAYTSEDFSSLSKNSCFVGAKLPGRIEAAFHGASRFSF
jgi:dihydroorotase